jgi:hypothetical protein
MLTKPPNVSGEVIKITEDAIRLADQIEAAYTLRSNGVILMALCILTARVFARVPHPADRSLALDHFRQAVADNIDEEIRAEIRKRAAPK